MNKINESVQTEIDAAFLYTVLSEISRETDLKQIYASLAQIEKSHSLSIDPQIATAMKPSLRARILAQLARRFGAGMILGVMSDLEKSIASAQIKGKEKAGLAQSGNETAHARIIEAIRARGEKGIVGPSMAQLEGRHRGVAGNALRAAVLGANDGLVSNLSLVMGVAGAAISNSAIVIAGIAGLLAGSISMAMGEWLSVQSSRELYERQIEIESIELEMNPEHEEAELSLIYQAKGFPKDEADKMAGNLIKNRESALEVLVQEELAIDPVELGGSAWEAAITSFILFSIGAIIPLMPFLLLTGTKAVWTSVAVSTIGLFGIGAAITLLTGKSVDESTAQRYQQVDF
ncbi:rubrerythrin family protein [bacterium]|nr:rubrerythrin family protein [bacterium]